jgi:hypothetical protein
MNNWQSAYLPFSDFLMQIVCCKAEISTPHRSVSNQLEQPEVFPVVVKGLQWLHAYRLLAEFGYKCRRWPTACSAACCFLAL